MANSGAIRNIPTGVFSSMFSVLENLRLFAWSAASYRDTDFALSCMDVLAINALISIN